MYKLKWSALNVLESLKIHADPILAHYGETVSVFGACTPLLSPK
jgi:hypothetical protein